MSLKDYPNKFARSNFGKHLKKHNPKEFERILQADMERFRKNTQPKKVVIFYGYNTVR